MEHGRPARAKAIFHYVRDVILNPGFSRVRDLARIFYVDAVSSRSSR